MYIIIFLLFLQILISFSINNNVTIITIINKESFEDVENLFGSLKFWEPNKKIVIYNVGLTKEQKYIIETQWCKKGMMLKEKNNTILYRMDFKYLHLSNINDIHIWKPIVIMDALLKYKQILWLNQESVIHSPLHQIESYLISDGYYFMQEKYVQSTTKLFNLFQIFNITRNKKIIYNSNVIGMTYQSKVCKDIIKRWLRCVSKENCISLFRLKLKSNHDNENIISIFVNSINSQIKTYTNTNEITFLKNKGNNYTDKYMICPSRGGCHYYKLLAKCK